MEYPINKKMLAISIFMFFITTFIPLNRLFPFHLFSPVPEKINPFDRAKEKLHERVNTYKLQNVLSFAPPVSATADYDKATAYAVIDFDSGEIVTQKNGQTKLPIASITKIMSSIVALDLMHPQDLCTVSEHAAATQPTKIGVVPGQQLSVEELLNAALLTSANDAVQVLKECTDTAYGQPVFIQAMNEKVKFIGLKNSEFSNPQGFDNPHNYSTVEDLAVISNYAVTHYPLLAQIVKKDHEILTANEYHQEYYLNNWNGLLDVYPNVMGVKIGNTNEAGTTTAVVSERNGKRIVVVLLGAPDILNRDLWASALLDVGFEKTAGLAAISVTENQLRDKYSTWKYFN